MKLRYQRVRYRGPAASGRQLEQMLDYLWDASRSTPWSLHGEWRPPVDVYQTAGEVSVLVELAGMDEEEIEVTLFDDVVIITGERAPLIHPGEDLQYHEAGVRYGRFRAEVFLPVSVNADATQAQYDNGLLRISLPKQSINPQSVRLGVTENE